MTTLRLIFAMLIAVSMGSMAYSNPIRGLVPDDKRHLKMKTSMKSSMKTSMKTKKTNPRPAPAKTDTPTSGPTAEPKNLTSVGNDGDDVFPLGRCEGDCDSDADCDTGLVCFQRSGTQGVPGCEGTGDSGDDYCYEPEPIPPPPNSLDDAGSCSSRKPCDKCQGDCGNKDNNCATGLVCYARTGGESVPGCVSGGEGDVTGADYCSDPSQNGLPTYIPGKATVYQNGLRLSEGLTSRIIAVAGTKVQYETGGESSESFHSKPDGAGVFKDDTTGGWIYVSNSEEKSSGSGGVGAITFDSQGRVVGYEMILTGTSGNCGGSKTFYNTWLTCEEVSDGQVWEVDPWGQWSHQTILGDTDGDEYESAAYDNRDPNNPFFFVTTDSSDGPIIRFTPSPTAVQAAVSSGDYTSLLTDSSTGYKREYLKLNYDARTFEWTTSITEGKANSKAYATYPEGIDFRDGMLYITTKKYHLLFILDTDNFTFEVSFTSSGAFDSQPDQVQRIVGDGILYFCEDGGDNCGVHARDSVGNFFTILQDEGGNFAGETTGLAFSPDNMLMYVSFQKPGYIFEIKRTDGYPFNGQSLDIKYHADDTNGDPFMGN
jgi:hypothetical protein